MTDFMKKTYVALTLLAITSLSSAFGEDWQNASDCEYSSESCCPCPPVSCGCGEFFGGAEFIYWRAFQSGFDFCVPGNASDTVDVEGRTISTFQGESRDLHFKWNPGFRIGAGYSFGNNHWDVAASWTHLYSHAQGSHGCGNNSRWNLNFDQIDLVAEYDCDLGCCFSLTPFLGVRGARINQKLHTYNFPCSNDFVDSFVDSFEPSDLIAVERKNKADFWGVGPLLGVEIDWNIRCGFSLYINASASWLYGKFDVRVHESQEFVDLADFSRVRKHSQANLAVADAGLGIRWHKCFCGDKRLVLQLGLEHHRYFDYNRFGNYGDLSFDGVNFGAGFEF